VKSEQASARVEQSWLDCGHNGSVSQMDEEIGWVVITENLFEDVAAGPKMLSARHATL
jgi:hypothetical protein